ncbi:hypothetical protein B5X24_HaOG202321 [Helicoverpa armigera]|uniref:Uncharacterized protein n=1 Tax=Helicoverpa armigera TaxID=29058 RepID=A0A2W1BBS3_HELAM|nr:hypothetical protein B5X24_HaOG202321 [Helicoverpa armigera]
MFAETLARNTSDVCVLTGDELCMHILFSCHTLRVTRTLYEAGRDYRQPHLFLHHKRGDPPIRATYPRRVPSDAADDPLGLAAHSMLAAVGCAGSGSSVVGRGLQAGPRFGTAPWGYR